MADFCFFALVEYSNYNHTEHHPLVQGLQTEQRLTFPLATRDTYTLGSRHETYHGFFITRRPKNCFLDHLLHQYQGLSRQMKIVASVKPFVTITASPAPIETIPTHLPTKCELCLKDLEVITPASAIRYVRYSDWKRCAFFRENSIHGYHQCLHAKVMQ